MFLNRNLFKSLRSNSLNWYRHISELPIDNWWLFQETGNVNHAIILPHGMDVPEEPNPLGEAIWEDMNKQYFNRYGVNERYLMYMRIRKEIARLKLQVIITGDHSIEAFIRMEQGRLEAYKKKGKEIGNTETTRLIMKDLGFAIKTRTTSTQEYYDYLSAYQKSVKK